MSQTRYQLPGEQNWTHESEAKCAKPVQDGVQTMKSWAWSIQPNSDRSDREKWSTKGGPVFLKLFRLDWNFRKFWLNGSRPAWHTEWLLYHVRYTNSKRSPMLNALRIYNTSIRIYNVSVKSKLQLPPPPRGNPRGFDFFENYCSNSLLPGPKYCSNAPPRVHTGHQMPPPRGHFTGT